MTHETLEEIPDEEWDHTLATNLGAFFHFVKAAVPHVRPDSDANLEHAVAAGIHGNEGAGEKLPGDVGVF
ncbi:hypothetical protein ABZU76_46275 [Amycolatopsis sp. NPDC005232]|uniref:hypothetical protein n=1 Tax=Amycolatopsis sp. NPDC005232 TaxID=3157027 RepID=UPI0033A073F3